MYQFSEMFKEITPETRRATYRWQGLGLGLLLGWAPGWAVARWIGGGGWAIAGIWLLTPCLAYLVGSQIKK
jgi:hypothetical protein